MRLGIQARYSLVVVMLLAVTVGLIVGMHLMEIRSMFAATSRTYGEVLTSAMFSQVKKQGEGLGRFLASVSADSIHGLDVQRINEMAGEAARQDGVLFIVAYNAQGRVLGEAPERADKMAPASESPQVRDIIQSQRVGSFSDGDVLNIVAPVMTGRSLVGWIKIGLSLADVTADIDAVRGVMEGFVDANQRRFVAVYIAVAVIIVLLGLGISLMMVWSLVRPILALSRYTRRIGAGAYDEPPPVERSDELGDLAHSLGQMAKDLKQVAQVARLATLGEMAVGMAHELSQPLNTIRLAAENTLITMEQGKSDDAFERGKLELIVHQAENMGELIKRMCVVGRSEGPQGILDPCEAVRDAYSLLASQYEDEGIAVTLDVPDQCALVLGRRNELAQVVINLLSNAHDAIVASVMGRHQRHTPTGGRIEVSVENIVGNDEHPADVVRIRVKDNGGGIPPDVVERIFDPFFTTKEVTKGTGLGLSISFGIVNAMGGRITVENFGGGALFTITLPAIQGA